MSEKARLVRGSIAGHLVRQTAPMIIGVSAMVSTGIVDAYYVGRLGATELAAISFIFPVGTALSSLGVGVMVGTSSVVSRAIGAGNERRAASCATLGVLLGLGFGLLIALALALGATSLFSLMGADGEALRLIGLYMLPYALGFPLLLSLSGLNGTLRAQGLANRSTLVSLSFALANWVLDPILIDGAFGFEGFGMAGAAYATVAGWLLGLSVGLWAVQGSEIPLRPALLREADVAEGARDVLRVALPASFTSSINPLGLAILTGLLAREGEAAVGGFGIGGRLQTFAVVPLLGLSGSIGAIVGQNWGAAAYDRARLALVQSGLFCLVYGLVVATALYFFCDQLAALFTDDPATRLSATSYLRIAAWGYAAYGVFIVCNGAFNAVGHATKALVLSLARVALAMVPFALLLQPRWGASAVYSGELVANLAGGLIAAALAYRLLAFSNAKPKRPSAP
ncbi:MATE family efflux transporter [Aurantiacibacter xanthus]|uniref:MATE family efflux transporter n=1 Tax=Aurantiacibacter xanthus TaxID=1784712 RepID=A0A3A1P4U9_9SPHN|nr:MATE family efflux transporter [Aurantiacibacter xanthus]RIV88250.1 MATE family efflux transporter [Aurantiacibacter xanthus]